MNPKNSRHSTFFESILILAALIAAVSVLSGCSISPAVTYKNAGKYKAGNFEYHAADVNSVEVNWISGKVVVKQSDSSTLSVSEEDSSLKDRQKLHWYLDGDKLIIQFCKSGYHGSILPKTKNLTVEVPSGIDLDVDTVSSTVTVENDKDFKALDIDTVSGGVDLGVKECGSLDIDTTSGGVDLDVRECSSLDIDTVSGNIGIDIEKCGKISADSVSGDVSFRSLPSDGAEIRFSKVSGSLKTDLAYEKKGDKYIFGDGKCSVDVDTVSGDLLVQ